MRHWFNNKIQPELAEETDPICRKFQIPRSSEDGIDLPWSTGAVHGGRYPCYYSSFCSQSGDCWGMIGSLIALLLTGHFILPIALVYGQLSRRRSATKQGESKTQSRNRWISLVGFVLFHWEPQDRQYVRENESRVRVGSKRTNDAEAGGFWGTDWESWARAEKTWHTRQKKQPFWSNNPDRNRVSRNINLKAKAGLD